MRAAESEDGSGMYHAAGPARWLRAIPLAIVVAIGGLSLTLLVVALLRESEVNRTLSRFDRRATEHISQINRNLELEINLLKTMADVWDVAEIVTPDAFRRFLEHSVANHPDLRSIDYLERVPASQRAEYESALTPDGSRRRSIVEFDPSGKLQPAGERADYFPLTFVASREPDAAVAESYGLDFGVFADWRHAMQEATRVGKLIALPPNGTGATNAMDAPPGARIDRYSPKDAFFFVQPLYAGNPPAGEAERKARLEGFAVARLPIANLMQSALARLDLDFMRLHLFAADADFAGAAMAPIYCSDPRPEVAGLAIEQLIDSGQHHAEEWTSGGLRWNAIAVPTPGAEDHGATRWSWLTLVAGCAATAAGSLLVARTASERRRLSREVRQFWNLSTELLCVTNADGVLRRVNPAWSALTGEEAAALLGRSFVDLAHAEDRAAARAFLEQLRSGNGTHQLEMRMHGGDGRWRWIQWSAALDDEQRTIHAVARDVTEQRATFEELERRATIDSLTNVLTRRALFERLGAEIQRAKRYGTPLSLAVLDLDQFKLVNDQHGHEAGDELLRRLGQLLRKSLRDSDLAGRFGGDEFVIVMPQTDLEAARRACARILRALHDHGTITTAAGASVPMRASVGVSTLRKETKDATELVARADEALYRAKGEGRGKVG